MVTWIVVGVLVFAVLLLVLVALPVLGRLHRLGRSAARTQRQVAAAQTLQMSLAHLQERLASVQEHATAVQDQMADRRRSGERIVSKG